MPAIDGIVTDRLFRDTVLLTQGVLPAINGIATDRLSGENRISFCRNSAIGLILMIDSRQEKEPP